MEVTELELERVPPGNVRPPVAEFVAVWASAEWRSDENARLGVTDWYAGGVCATCRWLARAVAPSYDGRRRLPRSPATEREVRAYEELIEAEFLAAEQLDVHRPDLVRSRPGWTEAIRATLRWAWRGDGPPPLPLDERESVG